MFKICLLNINIFEACLYQSNYILNIFLKNCMFSCSFCFWLVPEHCQLYCTVLSIVLSMQPWLQLMSYSRYVSKS